MGHGVEAGTERESGRRIVSNPPTSKEYKQADDVVGREYLSGENKRVVGKWLSGSAVTQETLDKARRHQVRKHTMANELSCQCITVAIATILNATNAQN